MAKPQRRTININDALAEIAATSEPAHAAPLPRGHVTPGPMGHRDVPVGGTTPDGYRIRVRKEKPHVSLYAHPKVFATIRDLAASQRKRPHDLYAQGMRLMLKQYGFDFDALNRGE
jgi:hypothetical protein